MNITLEELHVMLSVLNVSINNTSNNFFAGFTREERQEIVDSVMDKMGDEETSVSVGAKSITRKMRLDGASQ